MRRRLAVIAALAVALTLCATALAAGTPKTGAYSASGHIHFRFRLTQGVCYLAPKNLTNYRAGRGKGGAGLCFSSLTVAPVKVNCTGGASLSGLTVDFSLFDRLRLAAGRSLHLKGYTYGSDPKPIGSTEFELKFPGSRATGFVHIKQQIGGSAGISQCDSGSAGVYRQPRLSKARQIGAPRRDPGRDALSQTAGASRSRPGAESSNRSMPVSVTRRTIGIVSRLRANSTGV